MALKDSPKYLNLSSCITTFQLWRGIYLLETRMVGTGFVVFRANVEVFFGDLKSILLLSLFCYYIVIFCKFGICVNKHLLVNLTIEVIILCFSWIIYKLTNFWPWFQLIYHWLQHVCWIPPIYEHGGNQVYDLSTSL